MSTTEPSENRRISELFIDRRTQVVDLALRPDGTQVAYVVARTDLKRNKTLTRVWLADADGSNARVITNGDHDRSPVWSPTGDRLAFVSRRGEKKGDSTLHILPIDGPGETRTIATMVDGLDSPRWSPDGTMIAFASRTRHERYEAEDESWQAPRKIDRFFSQANGVGWVIDRPNHLYVVDVDDSTDPRNLTPGEARFSGVAWLADSSGLISSAACHDTWDTDLAVDIQRVGLDGTVTALTAQTGIYHTPVVSPDGTRVAFLGTDDPMTFPQNGRVGVLDLSGGPHRWVSTDLDRTFHSLFGAPNLAWLDSDRLIASAEDRGDQHLYVLDSTGTTAPSALTEGPRSITAFDTAAGRIAVTETVVDRPSELFVDGRALTRVSASFVEGCAPQGWEKFGAPTTDGTDEIDAWIMRPADFDPSISYPVLLNVHGGPMSQYGESFFDEAQMQAAAGYVVIMSNPRGSTGRDEAWSQAIMGPNHPVAPGSGWGGLDIDDILAVLDTALARYDFCDSGRVGMLGGSYGGWVATWLAGNHGDRFKAICSERAVNNMLTEEWTSDIATGFRSEIGPSHIDAPDEYIAFSPIRFADQIDVPMLIIHSEDDLRCPISQAEELFVALRMRGREVTFYRFPGENHELSRSGSPVHRVQRAEIILDFFDQHLRRHDLGG